MKNNKSISFEIQNCKAPCHNCTNRKALCHSTCKLYKEYAIKYKSITKKRNDDVDQRYTNSIKYYKTGYNKFRIKSHK